MNTIFNTVKNYINWEQESINIEGIQDNTSLEEVIDRLDSGGLRGQRLTQVFQLIINNKNTPNPNIQLFAKKIRETLEKKNEGAPLRHDLQQIFLQTCKQHDAIQKQLSKKRSPDQVEDIKKSVAERPHIDASTVSAHVASTEISPLSLFPKEIWLEIFRFLPTNEISKLRFVCKDFFNIIPERFVEDPILMRRMMSQNMSQLQLLASQKDPQIATSIISMEQQLPGNLFEKIVQHAARVAFLDLSNLSVDDNQLRNIVTIFLNLKVIKLSRCLKITDAGLQHLAGLAHLQELNLSGSNITDASFQHLAGLTHLKELYLFYCKNITDAGLQYLAGFNQLKILNLMGCTKISGAGLQHLAGFNQLKKLVLSECYNILDDGLQHLAGLNQLKMLDLRGCTKITDDGLQRLAGFKQLKKLNLTCCHEITDAGLQHLTGLTHLQELSLYECHNITDAGLQHLAGFKQLKKLDLTYCHKITDDGLQRLTGLTHLQELSLYKCHNITNSGLQHLARFKQLQELHLFHCKNITDAGLQHLAGLAHLQKLNLSRCKNITDAGLQHLAGLMHLQNLNLFHCKNITVAGLRHLAGLVHLQTWR